MDQERIQTRKLALKTKTSQLMQTIILTLLALTIFLGYRLMDEQYNISNIIGI